MLPECYTLPVVAMAVFASCGGCVVRYVEEFKAGHNIKIGFLLADIVMAGFLGFFTAWHLFDHTPLQVSHVMIILVVLGFIGSKILDIASYILYKKLGINVKFRNSRLEFEEDDKNDSTRNQKQ